MRGRAGATSWRDRGQAAVLVVAIASVLFVATIIALGTLGRTVVDRSRAQTAADAVALGAVAGGDVAARRIAAANDAVIVSIEHGAGGATVTVVVRVGDQVATARATDAP